MDKKKVDELLNLGAELSEKVTKTADSIRAKDEHELVYRSVMFFFFCKAYKSYQALGFLWAKGFAEDATVIARTLFEAMLQALYINDSPEHASGFVDHDSVQRYRLYLKLKHVGDEESVKLVESRPDDLAELKKEYDMLKDKFPRGKSWWGNTIAWLATQRGAEMERKYNTIYWLQSGFAHSAITTINEYIREDRAGLRVNCYPAMPDDPLVVVEATLYLLGIIEGVDDALDLGITDEVKRSFEEFGKTVESMK